MRYTTLREIDAAGQDVRVWCWRCARVTRVDAIIWQAFEERGWSDDLRSAASRLLIDQIGSIGCSTMASRAPAYPDMNAAIEIAVSEMMRVRHWGDTSHVSFPMYYPSGSAVTVRIMPAGHGYRIDDGGFAYRELEHVGFERSFSAAAEKARQSEGLERDRRTLFVTADADEIGRAMVDVAMASWNVADRVFGKIAEQEERDIEEYLRERLASVFGASKLEERQTIVGSSTSPWDVSAIVHADGEEVVFQAVSEHANSVYRTSTAFHDLAALPNPPKLVSVVKDRHALGRKLTILSQAGRVIQSDQPDDVYLRAAA